MVNVRGSTKDSFSLFKLLQKVIEYLMQNDISIYLKRFQSYKVCTLTT